MARLPNLYIVGAPRSGTTSLARWLGYHPEISMSRPKEPAYHNVDLVMATPRTTDRQAYLGLWSDQNATFLVEATTWYLYSETAAKSIRQMNPASKIVILLRDPVEMLASLHNHHVFLGLEREKDFETAVFGRRQPHHRDFRYSLDYLDVGRRAPQIARYLDLFGTDSVHFVEFSGLASHPRATHVGLLENLGLSPVPLDFYKRLNPARHHRSGTFRRTVDRLSAIPLPQYFWNRVRRLNVARGRGRPSPELRRRLIDTFEDDVVEIEQLVGKSFPEWREVR